jgi:outer membrane protein
MRKVALVVAMVFVLGIVLSAGQAAYAKEYKLGYVDLGKVFDEYTKTKESEKALEEKGKAKELERKGLVDGLKKLKDEQNMLSEAKKQEKQAAIDTNVRALQDFDTKARNDLMKERNDRLNAIMKDIETVVTSYAKESGYDMVLNSRTLLYGGEQYDVTAEVLKRLNK